jgi:cysteinyl-tRNA synthetase
VKYREPLNFTFESLDAARKALARFDEWSRRLDETAGGAAGDLPESLDLEKFAQALDDDLNFSAALGALFDVIRETNRLLDAGSLTPGQAQGLREWRDRINTVLAFQAEETGIPAEVQDILDRRAAARANRDWQASDAFRDELLGLGWQVKDTKDGQKVTRK